MRRTYQVKINNVSLFKLKLLALCEQYNYFACLESNIFGNQHYPYTAHKSIFAIDSLEVFESDKENLNTILKAENQKDWVFGHISYDLKNDIEKLTSKNPDLVNYPCVSFFTPRYVIELEDSSLTIHYPDNINLEEIKIFLENVEKSEILKSSSLNHDIRVNSKTEKSEYLNQVKKLKNHIQRGDIYEINYCIEFYNNHAHINPVEVFNIMRDNAPTPFSCLYKSNSNFLISSSPERYIKRENHKLISQTIKGTSRRSVNKLIDIKNKNELINSEKEKAENTMIVDLVRNDLSRCAKRNSVKVEELCGLYSFKHWHQLISTISCEIESHTQLSEVLKNTFPMGSMTGAPKIKAMELIEKYETSKRGLFSGSVGYIKPNSDFDFNVIIRSILYNNTNKYLSFMVGSAITSKSDPEKEYDECLLKSESMLNALKQQASV